MSYRSLYNRSGRTLLYPRLSTRNGGLKWARSTSNGSHIFEPSPYFCISLLLKCWARSKLDVFSHPPRQWYLQKGSPSHDLPSERGKIQRRSFLPFQDRIFGCSPPLPQDNPPRFSRRSQGFPSL